MKLIEVTFVKDASKKDYRKVLINPDMIVGVFKEDAFSIIKFDSNARDLTVIESFEEIKVLINQ